VLTRLVYLPGSTRSPATGGPSASDSAGWDAEPRRANGPDIGAALL
jgi:hypothetical protein